MQFTTKMPPSLRPYYQRELEAYRAAWAAQDLTTAWHHLERAHILGQPYPLEHTGVHWRMLNFGIGIKSPREIMGQLPRLLVGGVKSFVGKIPVGNTGGANVPPLQPMTIPPDLQTIIDQHT